MIAHVLRAGETEASVLRYGARIEDLSFAGRSVFARYDDRASYRADEPYLGAALGRTSGRIGGARLMVDGRTHALSANAGKDHLHGGADGFSHRDWSVAEEGPDRLALTLTSMPGDQGYPGRLDATLVFTLTPGTLRVDYEARCDAPTPVSLTHHPYVRLSGETCLDHTVEANASAWTPLTDAGIPTGEVADIAGTPLDVRTPRRIGAMEAALDGLDHGLVCPDGVRLRVSDGAHALSIASDQTHCQIFAAGTMGPPLGRHFGLAVEPQGWPDAEKHEAFAPRILRPGAVYRRWVTYTDG